MSTVKITPNESGALITAYKSNPTFGYMKVSSSTKEVVDGWLREKKRSALIRGEMSGLAELVKEAKHGELPGRICVQEFVESNVPAHIMKQIVGADGDMEQLDRYIKRAGTDGIELTLGGENIVRFAFYDATESQSDIMVRHDNQAEIAESKAAEEAEAAPAALPAGRVRSAK